MIVLPDQPDFVGRLHEEKWRDAHQQHVGNAGRPAGIGNRIEWLSGQHLVVDLLQFIPDPRHQRRMARIGNPERLPLRATRLHDVRILRVGLDWTKAILRRKKIVAHGDPAAAVHVEIWNSGMFCGLGGACVHGSRQEGSPRSQNGTQHAQAFHQQRFAHALSPRRGFRCAPA